MKKRRLDCGGALVVTINCCVKFALHLAGLFVDVVVTVIYYQISLPMTVIYYQISRPNDIILLQIVLFPMRGDTVVFGVNCYFSIIRRI